MNIVQLAVRESRGRCVSFLIASGMVAVAVAVILTTVGRLAAYDRENERLAAARAEELEGQIEELASNLKKLTIRLGYNTAIVRKDEPLEGFLATGVPQLQMPAEWGAVLAKSKPDTVNHLLPVLKERATWPENGKPILLHGVRGEIYIRSKQQAPMLTAPAKEEIILGEELSRQLGLQPGSMTVLFGRDLVVKGILAGRGAGDDVSVFVHSDLAEQVLNKPGQISEILALACECSNAEAEIIQREIERILPETRVILFSQLARSRDDIVRVSKLAAKQIVQSETASRDALRSARLDAARNQFAIVCAAAMLVVGATGFANVHERREEIGILRAIGYTRSEIGALFLMRSILAGAVGAGTGLAAGWLITGAKFAYAPDAILIVGLLVSSVMLAGVSAVFAALYAARLDPSELLRQP